MMLATFRLDDIDLTNMRVLIREDFNVPIVDGKVQTDLRIRAAIPGILQALAGSKRVSLLSHLGRPTAGVWDEKFSLKPVADCLQDLLRMPVKFVSELSEEGLRAEDKLVLYENVRFLLGETENSATLAQKMGKLCDIFVMDAFACAHRAHASTVGVVEYAPIAVAGPLLLGEVAALDQIMRDPKHPVVAIIGGAKISSKIDVLFSLVSIVDTILIGGGMANTFLAAQGYEVGASLCEPDLIPKAKQLLQAAAESNCKLVLPVDVIVDDLTQCKVGSVLAQNKILDIGSETVNLFISSIQRAKTILWNGPVGVFQDPNFADGTRKIAQAIAASDAYSVAGGGETLAALEQFNLSAQFSYVSTGGGAFLEYIEGKELPAIKALIHKSRN